MVELSHGVPAVRAEIERYAHEAIELRRYAHMHPELSWEEHQTRDWILRTLTQWGLEDVRPMARTGASGVVRGAAPGKTILWRADIDALPLTEQTGLPFASRNSGTMHACGHDTHIGVALALAHYFAEHRPASGNVRFAFQPAEEVGGGAAVMIQEGILDAPHVDACLGFHADSSLPAGCISAKDGPFMPIPAAFELVIHGRGGHAGLPHRSVDPVVVAAYVITALQTIVSRSVNPETAAVLSIGIIEGGSRGNIIPEDVRVAGSLRAFTDDTMGVIEERFRSIVDGVTRAFDSTYDLTIMSGLGGGGIPAVCNDPDITAAVRDIATAFYGAANVRSDRTTMSDDMALLLRERRGCYFLLGVGGPGYAEPNHSPRFDADERALPPAVDFSARLVEHLLQT
jgi:amidohydrolase